MLHPEEGPIRAKSFLNIIGKLISRVFIFENQRQLKNFETIFFLIIKIKILKLACEIKAMAMTSRKFSKNPVINLPRRLKSVPAPKL